MSELKQAIEDVGRLLEGKKCPNCHGSGAKEPDNPLNWKDCPMCMADDGDCTGLDPQYDPLRELFRVKCHKVTMFVGDLLPESCECYGTGYVTRLDWLTLPEGCLEGAIYWVFEDTGDGDLCERFHVIFKRNNVEKGMKPNLAATRAVLEVIG